MIENNDGEFLNKLLTPLTTRKVFTFIFLIGIITYYHTFFNSFVWDDLLQIVNNAYTHSFSNCLNFFFGLGSDTFPYFRPVHSCTNSLIFSIFGPNPFYFHLLQLALHISNAFLIYIFLKNFFKIGLAFILSVIFLVHPINSETVNYISAIQDTLFFFFGLLALVVLSKYELDYKRLFLSSFLLLFSLFTKESGILFILIINFFNFIYKRKNFLKIFFFSCVIFAIYVTTRLNFTTSLIPMHSLYPIVEATTNIRLRTIPKVATYYITTFFYPNHLAISQDWLVKEINFENFYFPLLLIIFFSVITLTTGIYLWFIKREVFKTYLFFSTWFFIGMALHIQIIALDFTVAERWFYFASVGILGMFGVVISITKPYLKKSKMLIFIVVVIICILSLRTMVRNTNWKDRLSLYSHDVIYSDVSWSLETNLGLELLKVGSKKESYSHLKKSVDLEPKGWINWSNLGSYYLVENDFANAEKSLITAIKNNPDFKASYYNYGSMLSIHGDEKKAIKFLEESLKKFPRDGELWFYLTLAYYKLGLEEKALNAAKQAYQFGPNQNTESLYSRLRNKQPIKIDTGKKILNNY